MDAMEAILSRRSIRSYTSQKISDQRIKELLEAAMSAPSAGNEQPWHFVIINDRNILGEITRFHPYSGMLKKARVAILVCVDLDSGKEGFLVQDGSAATENLLIAAHAKGLGAVWLGIYPLKERITGMVKLLDLPERILPLSLISIGYSAEEVPRENRYDPTRVHTNRW
ncbi:MAG TPA: nitroreductase family protein [Thermodesulfobacteriota bacterium]|nr:nitroreductase family protein [Thermodesulfobacteriota bacterium]